MATRKSITFNLKFEKVEEVLKDVEGMQEEVEVYIQLTRENIIELLGNNISEIDFEKLSKKISELNLDGIIDNPKVQAPPIIRPIIDKLY